MEKKKANDCWLREGTLRFLEFPLSSEDEILLGTLWFIPPRLHTTSVLQLQFMQKK
jgi:hypothetical protein